ncbi:MAG: insulinase family protein [Oculatellaceae cyanobacterium Prado106]|jgi:predicted Zn-dependent peptidase|nr:insulinase family protein [Oculatellaceae cyanobacterium Prado106]
MPPITQLSLQNRTVHRTVLDNGMVVLAVENPAADIVAARFFIRFGSGYEASHQAGVAHLMATVMTKGTDRLSSQEIAEQVESVGASLGADSAADYFLMSLKTVSADFEEMLRLLGEVMRSPSFPPEEVDLERRLTIQSIRSMQEQPFAVANAQLREAMFQDHPYGQSSLGTEETVSHLTQADLKQYHQTYFRPDNIVACVVGRISPTTVVDLIQQTFGDWQPPHTEAGLLPLPERSLPQITAHPKQVVTLQETQQAIVMLGHLAMSMQHPSHIPLRLLNTYLGNGLSSRLFVELREKRGLAYEVSAFYPTRLDQSQFVVYIGTAPENTAIAREGLQQEVDRLCQVLLTEEELQAAKNKLLGQYALGKQTNGQIAQIFGLYETLGLGIEFDEQFQKQVAEVTAEMAQAAAQECFSHDPYLSLVGPKGAIDLIAN